MLDKKQPRDVKGIEHILAQMLSCWDIEEYHDVLLVQSTNYTLASEFSNQVYKQPAEEQPIYFF